MAFFNPSKVKTKPFPIPSEPIYNYPDVPSEPIAPDGDYEPLPNPTITEDTIITFYQTTDEQEKLNKKLQNPISFSGGFVEDTDILNPVISIESDVYNLALYNYAYINTTDRYYYVNIVCLPDSRFRCMFTVDALMSFKNQIKQLTGTLNKCEDTRHIDEDVQDNEMVTEKGRALKVSVYHPDENQPYFLQIPTAILVACGGIAEED